jgi:hypothetical protein
MSPSLTRGWVSNLLVQLFLVLARAVTLGSKSRRTHDHILLSHLRLSQPGGPGPCIYIPQEHGGPVIPPGTGFPFVASYNSQGCSGGILTRLHTGTDIALFPQRPFSRRYGGPLRRPTSSRWNIRTGRASYVGARIDDPTRTHSPQMFLVTRGQPARNADNLIAIREPIV